ncbi:DUF3846 domain-containing protein [Bacillus wiedmannii]|uniref:DUF3846 domain-containing protein n=1 Tax=Bacillus wiedmannii TaxID=1890302 RepID=UPI000BFE1E4B|nr:DUF3846 domain-containing protein [Bacillus wiedmannii]PHE70568.1 hypothetical protein COF77_25480 [Bacillus wiedmannii]
MKRLNYATLTPGGVLSFKEVIGKDTLDILREETGGYVDVFRLRDLDIWVDDEGINKQLAPNVIIKNTKESQLTDWDVVLFGTAVFACHDEIGKTVDLTEQAKEILKKFKPAQLGSHPVLIYYNYEV